MRLLILGASGGCGDWLVRLAAARGRDVTALVRPDSPWQVPGGVRVVRGHATDPTVWDGLLPGHEVVLCALGQRRAGKSPWARLTSPPDLMQQVMCGLLPAMVRYGLARLAAINAGGVGDSRVQLTAPVRRLVATGNLEVAYRDLEAAEAMLAASEVDWLAVRPVALMGGAPQWLARPVARYGLFSTVRRSEVATWMLDALAAEAPFAARTVLLGR